MENSSFRRFLRNFCSNSPWSYAVFWKLHQFQDQTVLIYEDGHYDHNVLQLRSRSKFNRFSGQEDIGFVTDLLGGDVPEWPITYESRVLSCHEYLLGQGVVGSVALNRNDQWLYSDDSNSMELILDLQNHPDDWLFPVSMGIQTTLLAPILPYGVLQLGSFEKVSENIANASEIKETILSLMYTENHTPTNSDETQHLWSSILVPEWENKDDESSFNPFHGNHFRIAEEFDATEFTDIEMTTTGYEIIEPFEMEDFAINSLFTSDMDVSRLYLDLSNESGIVNELSIEAFENVWEFACQEDGFIDTGISSEESSGASEGHARQNDPQESSEKTFVFEANAEMSPCGWFDDEVGDHDYLFEAAIASLYENSENSSKTIVTSLQEIAPSFQVQNLYETNAAPTKQHEHTTTVTRDQSFESFESTIFEDKKPLRNDKSPKHSKQRRAESKSTSLRPRPRDRQLIQDRLKQLRKLVPSSAKSSIDGLLEQTTKHMTFLRSVTEQAKKVKQFNNEKITDNKNEANSRRPCQTQQAGKTTESCPIIVTDMENQGQFLIQMLCNREDVFFEMIEVMRQLNLSILQGVMDDSNNNWARFVVEASDGFNKLDIFWPLMRILQKNGDWMTKMNEWVK